MAVAKKLEDPLVVRPPPQKNGLSDICTASGFSPTEICRVLINQWAKRCYAGNYAPAYFFARWSFSGRKGHTAPRHCGGGTGRKTFANAGCIRPIFAVKRCRHSGHSPVVRGGQREVFPVPTLSYSIEAMMGDLPRVCSQATSPQTSDRTLPKAFDIQYQDANGNTANTAGRRVGV